MINLFDNISEKNKVKLLKILEADTLTIGKNLTLTNVNNTNSISIILSGTISVFKNDLNGNKILVEELYEDDLFGKMIFSSPNNEYELIAKEESKIITIEYDRILNTIYNKYDYYNTFIKNLLKILEEQINQKNNRIEILTKKTIRNKLLEYFKITSKKNGSRNIYLPFTYTEFADFLAVDRTAMTRELSYMKEEGLIETKGRKIILKY